MKDRVIIKEYQVKSLNNRKKIVRVFLPDDYYETKKFYPVIYMQDGQNLINKSHFSGYSWDVLNTLDGLHELTKGIIVVGIDCDPNKRILEYSPYISKTMVKYVRKTAGIPFEEIKPEADAYGEFVVNQLKPDIDNLYRTRIDKEYTYIAGSSCGGVISIYLGLRYQHIFSAIGAFSPAYRFLGKSISEYLNDKVIGTHMKIYHDMGTREAGILSPFLVKQMKTFNRLLTDKVDTRKILMNKDPKAKHNEYFWAIRFKEFITFIMS